MLHQFAVMGIHNKFILLLQESKVPTEEFSKKDMTSPKVMFKILFGTIVEWFSI